MKRLFSMFAVVVCVWSLLVSPVLAANETADQVISYEDGSYAIISMDNNAATRSTTGKSKSYTFYNPLGQRCFCYTLYAIFTYDGTTSRATDCEGRAVIYRQGWDMSSHSEYVSGNTAYGRATFTGPNGETRTASLTLTCDKNGNVT